MNLEELKQKYNIQVDKLESFTRIQVNDNDNAELYKDLKEYIQNCDNNISVANGIMGNASKKEFLQGEEIISQVLENIDPNWAKKQKAAFIHYQIGKLVSYIPDFNFNGKYANSPSSTDARNIWKSLVNGQSVCNGITSITRNLLSRVGITSKELDSGTHSFILAEVQEGNIIMDPTWDLKNGLYGSKPMYFGKTYNQLRDMESELSRAHLLDNPPENVMEISDKELREIYHSLGYTNEDRTFKFPILDKVNEIKYKHYNSMEEKINDFFHMFTQEFPKESSHLSETRTILESCMYELGIEPKDLTTKFVYAKDDKHSKNPYLSLFINNDEINRNITILDTEEMEFKSMNITEFDKKYNQHVLDTTKPFWKKYLIPEIEIRKNKARKFYGNIR